MHLMVPAVERAGYEPIKPTAVGADVIHAEIIRQLEMAELVLCDISTSNPNVFFELGIRTAVDKPVCVVKDRLTDSIPFDTSIINVHTYDPSLAPWLLEGEIDALAEHLKASAERSDGRNTLWRYFGLTTRAAFKEGESSLEEKVDFLLLQMQGLQTQERSIGTAAVVAKASLEDQHKFLEEVNKIMRREGGRFVGFRFEEGHVIGTYEGNLSQYARDRASILATSIGQALYLYKVDQQKEG